MLLVCSGATFMAFLDLSVVNIAFPKIAERFSSASIASLTWVVSGYAVMFAAFLTPTGRLADTVGRTKVFLASLTGFTVASVACGLAPTAGWLVASRFVQGALAAGMIPAALGLVLSSTPPQRLTKAIGAWSAAAGFSAVIGPVVGGLLVEQFSWRSVFLINVPVGVALLWASLRVLPRHRPPAGSRLPDFVGTGALALGTALVVAALTEGERWGWSSAATLGLLAVGAGFGAVALARSWRHPAPAIDTTLWASRKYAACNLVAAVFGVSMFAYLLAGALFATAIWRYSILQAAGALSVGAGAAMVGSIVAGGIRKPAAHRWVVATGALMFAGCTALMATDLFASQPRFWDAWVPAGILGGVGLGMAVTALSSAAATALPPRQFAAGVGMNLTARQLGGALGIAGLAAIFSAHNGLSVAGFHDLYRAATVVTVVSAALALGIIDRPRAPGHTRSPAGTGAEAGAQAPAKVAGA